ncbi:DUF5821 family protein [Halorubrum sp. Boch-26]|uniref:transcriptional regulator TbsP domain-containing protein n=1 Tax=Halorubrum sp. Boch-26 TaxID=2994426 RepID=UPI002468F94D|nr:DUF5821 family protein [Halorubrum sp. Boch-26]
MSPDPTLPFADGPGAIGGLVDPVLVDPSPSLVTAVIEAYREAAPELVEPGLSTLRAGASLSPTDPSSTDPSSTDSPAVLPTLTVVASDSAVDAVVDRFRPATRLAALAEAGVCDLLTLRESQPNAALVGRSTGHVLVASPDRGDDGDTDPTGTWCRVGDDSTLRERYAPLVGAAEERRLRAPSRRRVYEAVRGRCDVAVADDVVRALDAEIAAGDSSEIAGDPSEDDRSAPLDLAGARRRAYVVGVYRGALDRDLRRACEDAGLGSSATFTRIKRELREAGLLGTESVPQPVGRPRERLVARGALAEAEGPIGAVAAALKAT